MMKNDQKTDSVISSLVNDIQSAPNSRDWFTQYWFSWISCFSFIAILTYVAAALVPNDIHLPQDLKNFSFWFENALWLVMSLVSGVIGFLSAQPTRSSKQMLRFAYITAFVLMLSIVVRESPSVFADSLYNEVHWHRGPCGFFILATGLISLAWMSFILRRAAPTNLSFTALWTAVSLGSLGSMFMHLVCTHESTAHEILWHLTPLFLLAILSAAFGQKVLRW